MSLNEARRNSHEVFEMWFDKNIRSLVLCEEKGEDFDTVMTKWCENNNHEIREDGIYNMNIVTTDL